ncbi:hypothetical protein HMPREF1981_00701 [Bacteroides pyogenes F0041]|uniref:Lanthionine synthetase C-like protein n=1 Tax=Bacteroides pyogenes F0041 TaxID=1321819 RepID=U2E2G6_9BACE|nr:lanthionine synthetase LanC family protein [Bacteroides pyogenes]ERI88317.1 hypothetical protein HMPREF1981_00701 [Bacteroides pyogenes F0041]
MDKEYVFLKGYTKRLIEKGKCLSDIGLWNGKMGIAIYLLHLARITQDEKYENLASELTDAVYGQISLDLPFCFDNGLLGIGCGFEHIIHNGFADADGDEILSEIDAVAINIIDSRPIEDLGLGKGVCGIGCYLYHRLTDRPNDNNSMIVLKLKEYLIYLIDWMEELIQKTTDKQEYNDAYFLFVRLHKLDVFNHKIERLSAVCLRKMIDFNCRITDGYELLGIPSLKALKPWM